jgi:hypothetical protein
MRANRSRGSRPSTELRPVARRSASRWPTRAPSDEAHREPQKKIDSAIDALERKADGLYAKF